MTDTTDRMRNPARKEVRCMNVRTRKEASAEIMIALEVRKEKENYTPT